MDSFDKALQDGIYNFDRYQRLTPEESQLVSINIQVGLNDDGSLACIADSNYIMQEKDIPRAKLAELMRKYRDGSAFRYNT